MEQGWRKLGLTAREPPERKSERELHQTDDVPDLAMTASKAEKETAKMEGRFCLLLQFNLGHAASVGDCSACKNSQFARPSLRTALIKEVSRPVRPETSESSRTWAAVSSNFKAHQYV